ncbi:MAG: FAD-binding protein [Synergistaceae bacterium]|nr:FAD-binding protein [Synergistaceae bacterium]
MTRNVSRRDFLKASAIGIAGAAASSLIAAPAIADGRKKLYTPGTYSAGAQGLESTVKVTMTFDEYSILDVAVDTSGETKGIGEPAGPKLADQIKNAQGAEIDGISGATVTTNAAKKAAADCVAQAMGLSSGASPEASATEWPGPEPVIDDADVYAEVTADVVVVGLGVAGVTAARAAAELGATVIGIECGASPNCRSGEYAVINSPIFNKRWPERALTEEEVNTIIDSHLNESGYRAKRPIMSRWAHEIGPVFDWFIGADSHLFIADETRQPIEDENADDFLVPIYRPLPSYKDKDGAVHVYNWKEERFPCFPTSVEFLPSQQKTFAANWDKALATGKVKGYFGHFGRKLIMKDGRCVGVYALDDMPGSPTKGKFLKATAAKGVILSTGDYGSNDAAMYHFMPDIMKTHKNNRLYTSVDVNGVRSNQGDGLKMGAWAGVKVGGFSAPVIHHMGGGADLAGIGVMGNAGFLNLDMDGKRFMCEDLPGQQLENQIESIRLMKSWQIFDSNWPEHITHMPAAHGGACYYEPYTSQDQAPKNNKVYRNWKSPYQLEEAIRDGRCIKADTLEELIARIYPDDTKAQQTALASVRRYNELCAKGVDEDFNKVSSRLLPVEKGPFYADQFTTAIMLVCIGGLESDEDCHTFTEITDAEGRQVCGEVIRGLYVAGNMQGGRFGLQYPIGLKGLSHSMAMFYGKVAGENAVNGI